MRAGIPLADQPDLPARKLDMILAIEAAAAEAAREARSAAPTSMPSPDGGGPIVVRTPVR